MIENIVYHTDYIYNYKSIEKINEIIAALNLISPTSFYNTEGVFTDVTTQSGSPVDTPKMVSYGTNKDSDNGHVTYNNGVFTINTTGYYSLKSRLRAARTGASGTSQLYFWAEISTDSGSTWDVAGTSVSIPLENAVDSKLFFDHSELFLPAGTQLRSMFARSSTGDNSGDLVPSTPSASLTSYGLLPSPSAQLTIYKAGG